MVSSFCTNTVGEDTITTTLKVLLGLVLCLGPTIQARQGYLPRPSISAEPGSVIPWGTSVTFVCQGPPEVEVFLLEKDGKPDSLPDVKNSSGIETEARFPISSVKTDTAGRYNCIYFIGNANSEPREFLELVVTGGPSDISPSPTEAGFQTAPTLQNYKVGNCVHLGLACVVLLMLLVILAEAWHSQCRSQRGPTGWRQDGTSQRD
ncbi:leukocyte-associated immunoglobulin-like receptor 1 isoform X1 [Trichechus manatus latirostris]|uniref:Leukocyte-associated immunoglobulin-like receptor 1 isoform X1 n=1 Tax=Trichechus manatus latirostris TaxID=127582 RepID=A0A2Y9RCI9_TRIMA|nr:leukocyte-associated immunoglobulin-like receptor 1 isoform X1 [Trichechus manatus latirostris]